MMKSLIVKPPQFAFYLLKRSIRHPLGRCLNLVIATSILLFTGNAYAVIDVGLAIENDLDLNGNITVVEDSRVKVAYSVIEDTDGDLNKNDKIQLLRVSDDSIVASVKRGKKKTGSVSLKVKNSVEEQLYVRYVRRTGSQIARTSHPSDPGFIPLLSIARASTEDLTLRLNAIENAAGPSRISGVEFVGSASDIPIPTTASTLLSVALTAPSDGFVIVSFSSTFRVTHTVGTTDSTRLWISTNPNSLNTFDETWRFFRVLSNQVSGTHWESMHSQAVFPVSAGTTSFYARADSAGNSATARNATMNAVFVPNRY